MVAEKRPLILTLRLDSDSQHYFNALRKSHFPPERNDLAAHLTLFHQLPQVAQTTNVIEHVSQGQFDIHVTGLTLLGRGVAFTIESKVLNTLRSSLAAQLREFLIPQDLQGFRPHITIQNKVLPETAKALKLKLEQNFSPSTITAIGLDLWVYLNGPWEHYRFYPFKEG